LTLGKDVREALRLDDQQFLLKLTPNRPDCLGVRGIAREVAALSGASLASSPVIEVQAEIADRLPVRIEAPDLCGRFCGRVIRGVNPQAQTPQWMKDRLERAGQRSISALVDISNYVMLELSRPTHVFDLDRIKGGLSVRWARRGERLKLLNGQTIELDEQVGVIADDQAIESLAGIMGGDATAVSDDTSNIYVEAAFWWPSAIAGRSRRFNFSTLKMDRCFLADIGSDKKARVLVSGLIDLAHDLNCSVIAEGVESDEQVRLLAELGCDVIQGFLVSRPLPFDEIPAYMKSAKRWFSTKSNTLREASG